MANLKGNNLKTYINQKLKSTDKKLTWSKLGNYKIKARKYLIYWSQTENGKERRSIKKNTEFVSK